MDETIFKDKPREFKKILALNSNVKQGKKEQPCET